MTQPTDGPLSDKQESVLEKLVGMTAKLEDPATTDEERDTAQTLIARLMEKYSIEQARIDMAKGRGQKQALVEKTVYVKKASYSVCDQDLISGLASGADLRLVLMSHKYGEKKGGITYHLLGFEDDADQALVLFHSLQAQAALALSKWIKSSPYSSWMTGMDKYKARRDFMFGFYESALRRINDARRSVLEEEKAADLEIAKRLVENHEPEDAPAGAELVLATKRERVKEFVEEKYPVLGKARGGNVQRGYGAGWAEGHAEGKRANVGGRRAVGGKGLLDQ